MSSIRFLRMFPLLLLTACQSLPSDVEPPPECVLVEPTIVTESCECLVSKPVSITPSPCLAEPSVASTLAPLSTATDKPTTIVDLLVIGRVENVWVLPNKIKYKARIDTGAGLSSLHAVELLEFERDGKPWVKFSLADSSDTPTYFERPVKRYISIKRISAEPQRRPVVSMGIMLGSIEEPIDMTLADRTGYLYPVLIGRNFLRDQAIVDVSKKFSVKAPTNKPN